MPSRPSYTFDFGNKFSEQHIDKFSNDFHHAYPKIKGENGIFNFDLSSLSWISNQELLVLTGLLQYLLEESVAFKVFFLKKGSSEAVDRRAASQIVQIWDVWKIYQIIPDQDYSEFFDINNKIVDAFRRRYNINSASQEIYNRYGVTPFISLDKIQNFDDSVIHKMMDDVYKLSSATNQILRAHNCLMPFESQTLSSIITKELYENFLDHFKSSLFATDENWCFLSLSLKAKLPIQDGLQKILERNFSEELIPELKNFYYDKKLSKYKNESVLQFSFVDFGQGIVQTLFEQYQKNKTYEEGISNIDSQILAYAFQFDSSKDPIEERYLKSSFVPRGLFDLISIVRRFNGLLIARSNKGRVMFDFSDNRSFQDAISYFGNGNDFFPGTLISIYIPERENDKIISTSVIKPDEPELDGIFLSKEIKHVSLLEIQKKIKATSNGKKEIYNILFKTLTEQLISKTKSCLIYLDFKGYEIDERISRKIIFFLISDYSFNLRNSLIVINPPELSFLDNIKKEINSLSEVVLHYKVHPLPFVSYDVSEKTLGIYWLGVYSNADIEKLNQLLFEMHDLRKSDFEKPSDVIGNVNYYDEYGNLKSILSRDSLIKGFSREIVEAEKTEVERIVKSCILRIPNTLFLCIGNYYQHEYIQMFNALSDLNNCDFLANALYEKIECFVGHDTCKFLSLTTNSTKIINSLLLSSKIRPEQVVKCHDYQALLDGENFTDNIEEGDKFILICDVNSTGYAVEKLDAILERAGATLVKIAVLVNAIDKDFESEKVDYSKIDSRLISLYDYPMKKFRRTAIREELIKEKTKVVRVHPYTYAPILGTLPPMSNPKSENLESRILLTNQEFVDIIGEESIKAGYYKFNNLIHPYFFDMDSILEDERISKQLLKKIFSRIPKELLMGIQVIFYPKNSGIRNLKFDLLKNEILKDQGVKFLELERFETGEGWRFPHPPIFYQHISENKHVLILDDGSCSGESLIQMIDEVSSLGVKQILILSIIGRVNDHKRDFFSRIKFLSNDNSRNNDKAIKVDIFFGSHWHIPTYYIEESPVIQEKKWLEDIYTYPNIPEKIKEISLKIFDELKVKRIDEESNRYLLKTKDAKNIIKDLILRKEEVGKVSTYRFYKEYFYFFDDIIKTYETNSGSINERYQKIELVCAVFLHEPYLFKKIRLVLPDLTEKLEEFIQTILFGNPNKEGNPRLFKENLFYKWTNKDLIHLLFIIFDQNRLSLLLDAAKLGALITEFCDLDTDLNYLFFKLLKYFPISRSNPENLKYSGDIMNLINAVIDNQLVPQNKIKKIKRFRSFTTTLANQDDFISALTLVKNNYSKLTDEAHHKESLNVQWDIIESQLDVLKAVYSSETEQIILNTWEKISPFIAELLSFSKAYPSYFAACSDKVYNQLEIQGNSLRALHGEITELIFSLNVTTNIPRIQEILAKIYSVFISSDSDYYKIFNESSATDVALYYVQLINKLKQSHSNIVASEVPSNVLLSIPGFFVMEAFDEISQNLRHADTKSNISFNWSNDSQYLTLKIENKILDGIEVPTNGGGVGISKLESLNSMPGKEIQYVQKVELQNFVQLLKFKKI